MRTRRSHLAGLLAFGLLASLVTIVPSATAGCESIVAQPSGCATAIYYSAKKNVFLKLGGAGDWMAAAPDAAISCSELPAIGLDLPGLPAVDVPAVPDVPGTERIQEFSAEAQEHLAAFQDGVDQNLGGSTAALISGSYGAGLSMAVYYSDEFDAVLLAFIPQTFPDDPGDLPALPSQPPQAPDPGDLDFPTVPEDPLSGAAAFQAWLEAHAGDANGTIDATVFCVRNVPLP